MNVMLRVWQAFAINHALIYVGHLKARTVSPLIRSCVFTCLTPEHLEYSPLSLLGTAPEKNAFGVAT